MNKKAKEWENIGGLIGMHSPYCLSYEARELIKSSCRRELRPRDMTRTSEIVDEDDNQCELLQHFPAHGMLYVGDDKTLCMQTRRKHHTVCV
jgi:hypothetical protein